MNTMLRIALGVNDGSVADIDVFHAHVQRENIDVIYAPTNVSTEPYGAVRIMAIRGPAGAMLEFFEKDQRQNSRGIQ